MTDNTIQRKEYCGTCDGFGLVRIMSSIGRYRWMDCPTCNGTGER